MNPALAVLQALRDKVETDSKDSTSADDLSILWVGSEGGMEQDLVSRAGVPFEAIPAAGLHGVGVRVLPRNLFRLARGVRRAAQILKRFQPDVMLFTGGYVAAPVALAGRKIPTVLVVPDIEPGLALKFLARFADRIAVPVDESGKFFSKSSFVVPAGYPIRKGLAEWSKTDAIKQFGLSTDLPVLLVFGGSSGARSINRALMKALPSLLSQMQIIHITGKLDQEEVSTAWMQIQEKPGLDAEISKQYRMFSYLHDEMGAAFAAADLVVTRAGASTLGELPLFGLPAVLVPYPYAWRYQKVNADYLVSRGAAVLLEDRDLSDELENQVIRLMKDPAERIRMGQAMRKLAKPEAAQEIAGLLLELAGKESRMRN